MTTTFQRGTKTHKVTSASVQPGTTLLTFAAGGLITVAGTKTGAELRAVDHTERVAPGPWERQSRIIVHFTDGTRSTRVAPSQTWMAQS
jgi:hypothetical protein